MTKKAKLPARKKMFPPAPPIIHAPRELKLDLACGQNPKEGFEGVDLYAANAKHRVDLFKFPFPWEDNSVSEIHCSHFIEHLPCREVGERDLDLSLLSGSIPSAAKAALRTELLGKDFLFAFFDECYRILKPEGKMMVICPAASGDRAFQDPTHRRFIVQATFFYLWRQWRSDNGLSHYRVNCNFDGNVGCSTLPEYNLRSPEVQAQKFAECRNQVIDWHATLIARK